MMETEQVAGRCADDVLLPFQSQLSKDLYDQLWQSLYLAFLQILSRA